MDGLCQPGHEMMRLIGTTKDEVHSMTELAGGELSLPRSNPTTKWERFEEEEHC